jgi:hypothetical protein
LVVVVLLVLRIMWVLPLVVVPLMFGLGRVLRRRVVCWLTGLLLPVVVVALRVRSGTIRLRRSVVVVVVRTRMGRALLVAP